MASAAREMKCDKTARGSLSRLFKEGTEMTGDYNSRQAEKLARLFKRIEQGLDTTVLRKQANRLLTALGPRDIAAAEQNLIHDGYSAQTVQSLAARFMLMVIPPQHSGSLRAWLPPGHLLYMIMLEHDFFRYFLTDLDDAVHAVGRLTCLSELSSEFRRITHITQHLDAFKEHIDREDDVIFPTLRTYGRVSLCQAIQNDHIKIRTEIDKLFDLVTSLEQMDLARFKTALTVISQTLCRTVFAHLFEEDTVLFTTALVIINDSEVWEYMKAVCDHVGYCAVHL